MRDVDVLVVGAGPSGLAAAVALRRAGVQRVEVVDREEQAGGVPRHCHHTGFGIRDLHRVLSGPAYARAWVERARSAGAVVREGVTVTGWDDAERDPGGGTHVVHLVSPAGIEILGARAVVLATGARERPRAARLVPGDRGGGVMTTGLLQQLVHLQGLSGNAIGTRAVVVGAEHVGFSAVMTLREAGVDVAAMVTHLPAHQTWPLLAAAAGLRYRVPLLTGAVVERVVGRGRVSAVEVRRQDDERGGAAVRSIPCDTVVFTGDWVPDHELARRAGLVMDDGSRGPRVDPGLRTSHAGVFAVGNLVHPAHTADVAARTGRAVVPAVLAHLRGEPVPPAVDLRVDPSLAWVFPQLVGAQRPGDGLLAWPRAFVAHPHLVVHQGDRLVAQVRLRSRVVANRPLRLPSRWVDRLDHTEGADPVSVSLSSGPVRVGRWGRRSGWGPPTPSP